MLEGCLPTLCRPTLTAGPRSAQADEFAFSRHSEWPQQSESCHSNFCATKARIASGASVLWTEKLSLALLFRLNGMKAVDWGRTAVAVLESYSR